MSVTRLAAPDGFVLFVLACASIAVGFSRRVQDLLHITQGYATSVGMAKEIWEGSMGAPARYRVLVPYAVGSASTISGVSFEVLYWGSFLLLVLVSGFIFFKYLRQWTHPAYSLLGVLWVWLHGAAFFFTEAEYGQAFVELVVYCLGISAIEFGTLPLSLVVFGTLNRESTGGLVILYLLRWVGIATKGLLLRKVCLALLAYLGTFVTLRLFLGFQHYEFFSLFLNLRGLFDSVTNPTPFHHFRFIILILAPGLILGMLRFSTLPVCFKRAVWFVPIFLSIVLPIARFNEVRFVAPLLPIVVPMLVIGLSSMWDENGRIGVKRSTPA